MGTDEFLRIDEQHPLRAVPADLAVTGLVTILSPVSILVFDAAPLRIPLGIVFVLFVPGYTVVAALFPARTDSPTASESATERKNYPWKFSRRSSVDGIERVLLSITLSLVIVPVIGLALLLSGVFQLSLLVSAVAAFTLVTLGVATDRRWGIPAEHRFRVPYREWIALGRSSLASSDRADIVLNALLVLSIVLAAGGLGYAIVGPADGPEEDFSAVYLLTEEDGELVTDDYPTDFEPNESEELIVGVDNRETQAMNYTVVVAEQDVERDGGETIVHDQRELDRLDAQIGQDESWTEEYELEPTMTGQDIRIVWLLYPGGDVPEEPSVDNAPYYTQLWITVDDSDGATE